MKMGPYELLEVIGRGGMATIYRGRHCESDLIVAIKVMAIETAADPVLLKRFEQEFWAAAHLHHPNLVHGLDFGLESGRPYLVMEYVLGQNLGHRVQKEGSLPEAEAVRIIIEVAEALRMAHRHNLIHRDVKPQNILLAENGPSKLTDLGLVKDLEADTSITRSRTCLGSINFMAPEQYRDAKHPDARCDIYGLAATLYYALTGLLPFQGRGNMAILRQKLKNDFIPPRRALPTLSKVIDAAICKALNAAREHRQGSCEEFVISLTEAGQVMEPPSRRQPEPMRATAAIQGQSDPNNRRISPRFSSPLEATCRTFHGKKDLWQAEVQDVSRTGIQLQLGRRFEAGAILVVDLHDERANLISTYYVKVCWAREVASQKWGIGCAFCRDLCDAELNTLLDNGLSTVVIHEREPLSQCPQ